MELTYTEGSFLLNPELTKQSKLRLFVSRIYFSYSSHSHSKNFSVFVELKYFRCDKLDELTCMIVES